MTRADRWRAQLAGVKAAGGKVDNGVLALILVDVLDAVDDIREYPSVR